MAWRRFHPYRIIWSIVSSLKVGYDGKFFPNVFRCILSMTHFLWKMSSKSKTRIVLNVSKCVNAMPFNANTVISSNFYEQFTNYCIIKLIVPSMCILLVIGTTDGNKFPQSNTLERHRIHSNRSLWATIYQAWKT